jgi:hypothetical protein
VELREPSARALYDTSVHFVVEGVAIRLQDDPRQFDLAAIAKTVRETEARRPSEHRRFRDVPISPAEQPRAEVGRRVRLKRDHDRDLEPRARRRPRRGPPRRRFALSYSSWRFHQP